MKSFKDKEELLIQCEKDLNRLIEIHNELQTIESNRKILNEYYKNGYPQDYSNSEKNIPQYRFLNEDSIWNVLDEQYQEKIRIIKTIVKSI